MEGIGKKLITCTIKFYLQPSLKWVSLTSPKFLIYRSSAPREERIADNEVGIIALWCNLCPLCTSVWCFNTNMKCQGFHPNMQFAIWLLYISEQTLVYWCAECIWFAFHKYLNHISNIVLWAVHVKITL